MRAAILEENYKIRIGEVDDLRPGPKDILIETVFAGVCGSDVHAFKGVHPFRKPPVVLGHELVGTVAEIGKEVTGFEKGDRVTVLPLIACGECIYCRRGRQNLCLHKKLPGIEGWEGAFAEYFLSKPDITFKVGPNTDTRVGALAEPLAVGFHAMRQGRVERGSSVLVLGAGTIGLVTAAVAHWVGAGEIAVTDLYDFNLTVAKELGATSTYRAGEEGVEERILEDHPRKFDVVFLCSGAAITVKQAMGLIQRGGRIVFVGMFLKPLTLEMIETTLNELEMIGTIVYSKEDFRSSVELLDSGQLPFDRLITHILPLGKAQHALELLVGHGEDVIKILLDTKK
ncbi:MAG: alcohol dehydrogenase catalytic domain-containing protein [Deltaproteobacteria bacterium]|nr:alcohol dehydrogenase catalytic domain-containing protein [Deltaproteobacteria bacterium]MBW2122817.1 alcohol dehydrogenase catalytic domain-containing protein [Deltaproteobacteria bacterium]